MLRGAYLSKSSWSADHHLTGRRQPAILAHNLRSVNRPVVFIKNAPARADERIVEADLVCTSLETVLIYDG